jgi:hypothetical protein
MGKRVPARRVSRDPDAGLTDREVAIKYAMDKTPLPLILRELLSEIRGKRVTDEEWVDWLDRVI